MDLLDMLCDNESLETLSMISKLAMFDDYLLCVAVIQPNTKLKSLRLHPLHDVNFCADQQETKELI